MNMSSLTEGYHQGSDYVYGYRYELNPLRLNLSFLNAGLVAPSVLTACELGFGQGESMNLHAAASATQWYGTDFNSAQASFAREAATASGAAAHYFDDSFAEFCSRTDLPDFDFIGMHGIWSWINDTNRAVIVDFLRRKLKAGGVLYICYNTLPGHAAFVAMQDVLTRRATALAASGHGVVGRIDGALDFANKLLAASPVYGQANPGIAKTLNALQSADRTYIAHEYDNREWVPTSVARLAEWLAPAKLDYACSAKFFDMVDAWNLTGDQQSLLNEITDTPLRETARDFMVNQFFRKDYWVKGARRLTLPEKAEGFRRQRIILTRPRTHDPIKAFGALGAVVPPQAICGPILDALADHRPRTLGQIEQAVRDKGVGLAKIVEVVLTLMETGELATVQEEGVIRAAKKQTDKLNVFLCDKARLRVTQSVLASPVIGTGLIDVGRIMQFFWLGMKQGNAQQPADLAAYASQIFRAEGMTILDEEKRYVSSQEGMMALTHEATFFVQKLVPLMKALQIL
jgi:SAM-dependent methyltransferase